MIYIETTILKNQFPVAHENISKYISKHVFDIDSLSLSHSLIDALTNDQLIEVFEQHGLFVSIYPFIPSVDENKCNWTFRISFIEDEVIHATTYFGSYGECNNRRRCVEYAIERCFMLYESYLINSGHFSYCDKDFEITNKLQQTKYFREFFDKIGNTDQKIER